MKKVIFFLLLLLPVAATSKNFNNDVPKHRVGISAGYSLKSIFGDSIRPFEITLKYQFKGRHTFHFSVPFYYSIYKTDYVGGPDEHGYTYMTRNKRRMYGLGVGYDYAIPVYKFISGFFGGEFEYSRLYLTYVGDIYVEGEMNSMWNSEVLHKAYSIIPYMGIRFSYRHWETEMKYELFLSKIKYKERGYYQKENLSWGTGRFPPRIYEINGVLSFNLTYYF